jgi:hypothetical protein
MLLQEFLSLANAYLGVFDLPHSSGTHLIGRHIMGALPIFRAMDEQCKMRTLLIKGRDNRSSVRAIIDQKGFNTSS